MRINFKEYGGVYSSRNLLIQKMYFMIFISQIYNFINKILDIKYIFALGLFFSIIFRLNLEVLNGQTNLNIFHYRNLRRIINFFFYPEIF